MKSFGTSLLTFVITILQLMRSLRSLSISLAHCEKNITVKYQVPVTKTRLLAASDAAVLASTDEPAAALAAAVNSYAGSSEVFIDYEERSRWDVVQICCPGHRTIIFGLCEAICSEDCPPHSVCAEPNRCKCSRGYEPSHHPNKEHQLICRPVCAGGCPAHSHCVGPSVCECRSGYRDVSSWFSATRCERVDCGSSDQRYDALRRLCVHTDVSHHYMAKGDGLEDGSVKAQEWERGLGQA